jgi:Flp pilus assembly protein CpaB
VENLLPKGLLGASRRPIVAGAAALVLATILLLVYLSHYRSSVKSSNASATALVAKAFIPKGTTALEGAKKGLWQISSFPKSELKVGAVSDAAAFRGEVALDNIYPGQQLTTADFGVTPTSTSLSGSADLAGAGKATGTWRAISIPLDVTHGIVPQVQTNDRVDVYIQTGGVMALLMQDVLVLSAPNQAAANTTAAATSANYILRVPSDQVPRFTFASDNAKLWFALRPEKGSKTAHQKVVTATNLLSG